MLWPRENFYKAYENIRKNSKYEGCTVSIFVASDIDALCSCKMLTCLLKVDMIRYSIIPVIGYEDLKSNFIKKDINNNIFSSILLDEIYSIIFINCGANINIIKYLNIPSHIICYIFDSHRPIHLSNIYDKTNQIILFNDEINEINDLPPDGPEIHLSIFCHDDLYEDNNELNNNEKEYNEEEEEEEEHEIEDKINDNDDIDNEEEEYNNNNNSDHYDTSDNDNDNDNFLSNEKQKERQNENEFENRNNPAISDPIENFEEDINKDKSNEMHLDEKNINRRRKILKYYSGYYHSAPSSVLIYEFIGQSLPSLLNFDLLWLAILGLAKQFILQQIDNDNYNLLVNYFQDEILSLSKNNTKNSDGTNENNQNSGKIMFGMELRFMLYRYWSLYNSMFYSNYIASKLQIWKSDGRELLDIFLAKMGLSMNESKQTFSYMDKKLKDKLHDKIKEFASLFGLEDIYYGSFLRITSFNEEISAADVVYSLNSLLETPPSYSRINNNNLNTYENENDQTMDVDDDDNNDNYNNDNDNDIISTKSYWITNFHSVFNALDIDNKNNNMQFLKNGFRLAKQHQKELVNLSTLVIERKIIIRIKHFRFCNLLLVNANEKKIFSQPFFLSKLAIFIKDIHIENGKWSSHYSKYNNNSNDTILPFVMTCETTPDVDDDNMNKIKKTFLIVGITCPETQGEIHKNNLDTAFRLAAEELGAKTRHDGFETAVMEIQIDNIMMFIEQLHNVMDA